MKLHNNMTSTDYLKAIYGTDKFDSFEFDTALSCNMIENILNVLFPERIKGSEENSHNWVILHEAVYCYGKYHFRGEGILPLTQRSKALYNWYAEKTGINLIFTPTLDTNRIETT